MDAYTAKLSWWLDGGLMLALDPWLSPETARLQPNVCCRQHMQCCAVATLLGVGQGFGAMGVMGVHNNLIIKNWKTKTNLHYAETKATASETYTKSELMTLLKLYFPILE